MSDRSVHADALEIETQMLEQVLEPYLPNCRYLKQAFLDRAPTKQGDTAPALVGLYGPCSIPESCYIRDTGHFNAVEFNICYNQLTYCLIAACAHHKALDVFADWDFEEFKRRQLPDVLIAKYSSEFHKPMKSHALNGRVDIMGAKTNRKGTIFLDMRCTFNDGAEGSATGNVALAIVNRKYSA